MICLLITGCYSTDKLISKSKYQAVDFSKENLSGKYQNVIVEKSALWNILAEAKSIDKDTTVISENSILEFYFVNDKKLRVDLIENDSIVKSMILDGKIKDDYFSIDKKLFIIPIPAVFILRERKFILGNDRDGNLILNKGTKDGAWILIMASDHGGISSQLIKRIKN